MLELIIVFPWKPATDCVNARKPLFGLFKFEIILSPKRRSMYASKLDAACSLLPPVFMLATLPTSDEASFVKLKTQEINTNLYHLL